MALPRAHKLDQASHTYYTSFPFLTPHATLCVGCGWGGKNPRITQVQVGGAVCCGE